jgi:Fic family protein
MAFVREMHKGVTPYYVLLESFRDKGKVGQRVLKYFGSRKKMLDYCKAHGIKSPKEGGLLPLQVCRNLEEKLGELNALRPLPEAALKSLGKKFEVEMTYNSNAIEGNRLSLRETFLVLEKGITIGGKSVREHLEATNHREAIRLLEKIVKKAAVQEKDVLELHAVILDKIDPQNAGFYRHEQVYITGTKHVPPGWKAVPEKMRLVLKELNSREKGCKAVESAVRLHHQLAWIHPFVDGNGRLARLLTNLRLMRAGFPPLVLLKRTRKTYYSDLEKADEGDLKPLALLVARDAEHALELWLQAARNSRA